MATCGRNVRVDEEDEPYRKSSTATIRSEGTGTQFYSGRHGGGGVLQMYDSSDNSSLDSRSTISTMRIRRVSSSFDGSSRFPKLQECAHFHYDQVELKNIKTFVCDEEQENHLHNGEDFMERTFLVKVVSSGDKSWTLRRTFRNFRSLDRQLHKCIYDRKVSRLPSLNQEEDGQKSYKEMEDVLQQYLRRFSDIAGSMINCGSVLNWFELDNRGNRLLAVDDSGINTPAIAAAHAVKRYTAQAADEISLEVGDIVSVIDMPTQEETIWWRGKRGFEVGFFPSECVEVIGDKVPASVENRIPNPNAILVRKHGKFLSFLRMFFSTRPARNQLKQSGIVKERVFGCDLGEHLLNSGHDVPLVLKSCSEVIEKHGIVDGIYRLSGITSNIQKLRVAFDEDRVPDLTADTYLQDIHSISSLLKMYFRELPNPLLTYQLYDKFADAVRDEDNKLWKIHDVVQQLPPPHYRTTEYLMRHLAKVAGFGPDTGMHSKNLAIVWAPNLLRSKELESGGGAAALQGVGIQAVVTECLILYADLIFSDKMPAYSSPELHSSHKKPRPKSLAISTPTKLITLEEARERALSASLRPPPQKYIDVGGGPEHLPSRYHTVIDLPGYRKKANIRDPAAYSKVKKSPSGWRSIFSRSTRQNSIKQKGRKSSVGDPLPLGDDRKAITEEDVHNWKRRRLRGAKSAESLLAMSMSGGDSGRLSRQFEDSLYRLQPEEEHKLPGRHKRSMSSESPRVLSHSNHAIAYPSFIMAGEREVGIDVDTTRNDTAGAIEKHVPSPENRAERKQSFVRGDNKRRVITHRRTPSAPSTPRQDDDRDDHHRSPSEDNKKSLSQSTLDCQESKIASDQGKHVSAGRLDMNSLDAEKFVLHVTDVNVLKTADGKLLSYSPEEGRDKKKTTSKTPPSPRDGGSREKPPSPHLPSTKLKDNKEIEEANKVVTIELPESPGCRRKNWMGSGSNTPVGTPDEPPPSSSHFFYSRHHDYAEILSDEENEAKRMEIVTQADVLRSYSESDYSAINSDNKQLSPMEVTNNVAMETTFSPSNDDTKRSPVISPKSGIPVSTTSRSPKLSPGIPRPPRELRTNFKEKSQSRSVDQSPCDNKEILSKMSKCLSVPADIQKSLEDMTYSGSQSDMLSSVTISELSASADSFNIHNEDVALTTRRRRSASVDSINEIESPLTRTLREINAQIDKAFKHDMLKAHMLQEGGTANRSRSGSFDNIRSESLENDNEMFNVNFAYSRSDNIITPLCLESGARPEQTFVERPAEEIQVVETPRVIRAPLRSSKNTTNYSKNSSHNTLMSPQHDGRRNLPSTLSPLGSLPSVGSHEKLPHSDLSSPMSDTGDDVVVKSRHQDSRMVRSDSRHGRVEFDLSDEDLDFLSRQGILQDMKKKLRNSDICSPQSPTETVQWSPETARPKGLPNTIPPSSPHSRKAGDLPSGHGSHEDLSKAKGHSSFKSKPPARREFEKLLLESAVDGGSGSPKSSPRSPRQQPRWEDLAGLNQDFSALAGLKSSKTGETNASRSKVEADAKKKVMETNRPQVEEASFDRKLQDLSDFNDVWRQQLAPTGDVCRSGSEVKGQGQMSKQRPPLKKSSTIGAMELTSISDIYREKTPECGTVDQTVTLEKPMIKKCLTESDLPQIKHCSILTQDSQSTTSSSGTSEAMSEVHNVSDRVVIEKPSIRREAVSNRNAASRGTTHPLSPGHVSMEEEKTSFPKPRKIQKMDSFEYASSSGLERMDTGEDKSYNQGIAITTASSQNSKSNSIEGMMTSNKVNTTETVMTSNQEGQIQSEVYLYSESSRSASGQGSNTQQFCPVLNEIDLNESCFGIPTHQNLSNEFREKMQERLKASSQQGSLDNPDINGMESLQVAESYLYQEQSEHAIHVGFSDNVAMPQSHMQGPRMEVAMHVSSESSSVTVPEPSSVTLPLDDITLLSEGPMVTADQGVIDALDNTEEAEQNAINDDLELTMSLKSNTQPGNAKTFDEDFDDDACCSNVQASVQMKSEPIGMYMPRDSASLPWQQNAPPLPELAPPEQEFMEVNRPCVIKSTKSQKKTDASSSKLPSANNSRSAKTSFSKSKIPVKEDHFKPPAEKDKSAEKGDKSRKTVNKNGSVTSSRIGSYKKDNKSSERGESILVLERKSSLKKKQRSDAKSVKMENIDTNDFDVNDDVFVDPSEIKSVTTVSHTAAGGTQHKSALPLFLNEPPNRSSLDESVLQVASTRHDDFLCSDLEEQEDIRFTRAHRSTKLKSLRELFEKTSSEQEKEAKAKPKKNSSSSSQERLVCLPKSHLSDADVEGHESPRLVSARNAFSSHRSYSHMDSEYRESYSARNSPLIGRGTSSIPYDDWQMPRSRRSISTDVGYELGPRPRESLRRERSWDRQSSYTSAASKPPKHRSGSRTRTASESSVSESDSFRLSSARNSPKSPRQDGSPKSPRQDSSPRTGRESAVGAKTSPKTQRFEEGSVRSSADSPLFHRAGEDISFHNQRSRQRSDGSPKINRKEKKKFNVRVGDVNQGLPPY